MSQKFRRHIRVRLAVHFCKIALHLAQLQNLLAGILQPLPGQRGRLFDLFLPAPGQVNQQANQEQKGDRNGHQEQNGENVWVQTASSRKMVIL